MAIHSGGLALLSCLSEWLDSQGTIYFRELYHKLARLDHFYEVTILGRGSAKVEWDFIGDTANTFILRGLKDDEMLWLSFTEGLLNVSDSKKSELRRLKTRLQCKGHLLWGHK